jgi:hypothetical protein
MVSVIRYSPKIWDKLQNIYEGDTKFKATKLQTYRGQFQQLKMKEDEDIAAYFLRVDETVNAIIGLGEEIEESVIGQKILRSLPMRFNPKIPTLEERSDLESISMGELHGIFTTYEMRTEQENPYVREASFKASKMSKKKKKEQAKEDSDKEDSEEEYEEAKEECEEVEEEIEEAEVDYREELMCSIEVIIREKKKNKKLQVELDKKKDIRELEQMIMKLKVQIEEDKRIEEQLKEQLE